MPSSTPCPNCGCAVVGRFCSECGQARVRAGSTLGGLLHEAFGELTSVDGRLLHTLSTILFRPGRITRDYFAGRRARYLPPFRAYLLVNVVLFFVLGSLGTGVRVTLKLDQLAPGVEASGGAAPANTVGAGGGWLGDLERRLRTVDLDVVQQKAVAYLPQLGFVLLPMGALLLQGLYWRRRMAFGDHLVTALHVKTAAALVLVLTAGASWLLHGLDRLTGGGFQGVEMALLWIAIAVAITHVVVSLHRIYGGRLSLTLLRALVLFAVYFVAANLGVLVLALLVAWSLAPAAGAM